MSEETSEETQHRGEQEAQQSEPERAIEVYGSGVRTALKNNATAYGFSISITAAYGLATGAQGPGRAVETVFFALGAALAFVAVGAVFITRFRLGSLSEGGQIATISGGIDVVSVTAAVAAAFGLSRIPGFAAWPLTGAGTVITYLLVGGLDVLIASITAQRTSFGRSQ
jgi:hypothetical protein